MLRGELYRVDDELRTDLARAHGLLERYNVTRHSEGDLRDRDVMAKSTEGRLNAG